MEIIFCTKYWKFFGVAHKINTINTVTKLLLATYSLTFPKLINDVKTNIIQNDYNTYTISWALGIVPIKSPPLARFVDTFFNIHSACCMLSKQ